MGTSCPFCKPPPLNPEIEKALKTIAEKSPEIIDKCVLEKNKLDNEKAETIEERGKKLDEKKDNKDEMEKIIKEYNKKEAKIDKELIANEVEKMHSLWELGIELSDPCKNALISEFQKKANEASSELARRPANIALNNLKSYSPKEFLNSVYGKPLKTALIKQGMSKELLVDFKKDLIKDRTTRRDAEKKKYGLDKNDDGDEDFEFELDDLYDAIFDEYKDNFKESIKKKYLKL